MEIIGDILRGLLTLLVIAALVLCLLALLMSPYLRFGLWVGVGLILAWVVGRILREMDLILREMDCE